MFPEGSAQEALSLPRASGCKWRPELADDTGHWATSGLCGNFSCCFSPSLCSEGGELLSSFRLVHKISGRLRGGDVV